MEAMIQKILELDREERSLTSQAELDKLATEQNITGIKNELREGFLERARVRAAKRIDAERQDALREWEETHEKHLLLRKQLDQLYSQKKDSLAETIVQRVIGFGSL